MTRGPIGAGSTLTIPIDCPAGATAQYYVYFDNPTAWPVAGFLPPGGAAGGGLTARPGPVEKLPLAEIGRDERWPRGECPAGGVWPYRLAVTAVNYSGRPVRRLVRADVSAGLGRFVRGGPPAMLVTAGGKPVNHYRLGKTVLLDVEIPPHTARTYHVYMAAGKIGSAGAAPGRGDAGLAAGGVSAADYEKLLRSPANLVRNGDFARGGRLPDGWLSPPASPSAATAGLVAGGLFGARCARLHVPHDRRAGWFGWRQAVPIKAGKTYLYAAWVRCESVRDGSVLIHAHYLRADGQRCQGRWAVSAGRAITGTTPWTLMSGTFTVPPDAATFEIHLTTNATGTVWYDGVILAEVQGGLVGPLEVSPAAGPPGEIHAWPVPNVIKVFREDLPPARPGDAVVELARNEAEVLQLAVRSRTARKGVSVHVAPPAGAGGRKLPSPKIEVVGYVPIDHPSGYYRSLSPPWYRKFPTGGGKSDGWPGLWPDPLLPGNTLDLPAGRTQPLWITFRAPAGAAAGDYAAAVEVRAAGKTLLRVPVKVHVWDFDLPRTGGVKAIYDVRLHSKLWQRPGLTRQQLVRETWRFMAARRLCPDHIQPEPVLEYHDGKVRADFTAYDAAAEYYFGKLKLPHTYAPHCFYLFGWGNPPASRFGQQPYEGKYPYKDADRSHFRPEFRRAYQACLKAYWQHMKARGWADKVVLYISDEPHDRLAGIINQMKAACEMIHEVDPNIPIYSSTWHHQPQWDESLDIWGIGHYGVVPVAEMNRLRRAGKRLWFTTDGHMCIDTPYCAIERLLPHFCFHHGAGAYEFWGVDWLTYNPYEFGWHRYIRQSSEPGRSFYVRYPNGDGYLVYPGGPIGASGLVSTIRIEQAREGAEDYLYLSLLAGLIRRAGAKGADVSAGRAVMKRAAALAAIPAAHGRYST
ncbi:MAG: DUF4091 domain-containing protein, partial [Planctomycetes bacterium]|nr:DUF4091 domain-containing protein [Planctomycetota bacterium]